MNNSYWFQTRISKGIQSKGLKFEKLMFSGGNISFGVISPENVEFGVLSSNLILLDIVI